MIGRGKERNPVRYAVVGLTLLVVLFLTALNFQRLPLVGGGETYRAEFTDASGLQEGEEVRVAGIKVGTVTDVKLDHARVIVTFQVTGVELGKDTTAGIEVKTLLGQHFLSLTPAGPGELEAGSVIPLARTSTPINIVPAFARLADQTAKIDTAQVADAFDALTDTMTRSAPELDGALQGLSRLSRSISSRDEQIRALFASANDVSAVVAARNADLAQLLGDTTLVLDTLERRRETITRIIRGTAELSRQLVGLVRDNESDLLPALESLNTVLDVLRGNKKQIDQILEYGALYGREFTNVGGSGHWFDASVKVPAGYAVCNGTATPGFLADLLNPVLGSVNQSVNGSTQPCLPLGTAQGGAR